MHFLLAEPFLARKVELLGVCAFTLIGRVHLPACASELVTLSPSLVTVSRAHSADTAQQKHVHCLQTTFDRLTCFMRLNHQYFESGQQRLLSTKYRDFERSHCCSG